jgi:hypothetical protein
MLGLSTNPIQLIKSQLPASAFPNYAEVYVCDNCGRNITRHFHAPQSHTSGQIGPTRYQCRCGQKYPTGAIEWDHLGDRRRKNYFLLTFLLGFASSVLLSVPCFASYYFLGRSREILIAACVISAIPFFLINLPFWFRVAASLWRTRVSDRSIPN